MEMSKYDLVQGVVGTEERVSTLTWVLEEERDSAKGKFLREEIPNSLKYVKV